MGASDDPWRRTDVLICGGGPAGIGAAIVAARQGAATLLVERAGRLGGLATLGLVGPLMGWMSANPLVDEVLARIGGRAFDAEWLDVQYAGLVREAGAELLLHTPVVDAVLDGRTVAGVRISTKRGLRTIAARVTVDATGDGDVAFYAGAAFEQGRPGDGLVQPVSIMYRLAGVDESRALLCNSERQAREVRVPEGLWSDVVHRGQAAGELPPEIGVIRLYRSARPGERIVNATQVNGVDGTDPEHLTRAELSARAQARVVLDFLRTHAPGYEAAYIAAMPAMVGVRETRRFIGAANLTREDVIAGRERPDAIVRGASFPIDIHNPSGAGQAEGLAAEVKPYDIPYGCLVPRDVDGLLLAGRCIGGSHDAHASYRVQCIAMATGAAAGAAAAQAARRGIPPRAIDVGAVQSALGLAPSAATGSPPRSP
jgi:hypothetical protein